jgi:hypothetical protein
MEEGGGLEEDYEWEGGEGKFEGGGIGVDFFDE